MMQDDLKSDTCNIPGKNPSVSDKHPVKHHKDGVIKEKIRFKIRQYVRHVSNPPLILFLFLS